MAKGRPPDPKREKRGTGNRPAQGKKKAATDAIVLVEPAALVNADLPQPPATLPESVHDTWFTAAAEMGGNGHMRPIDLHHLEAYCYWKFVFDDAAANVAKYRTLVKGETGPKNNPAVITMEKASSQMRHYSGMLGLDPGARIRLGLMEIAGMSLLAGLNESLDRR